jgi:hypothetical protein
MLARRVGSDVDLKSIRKFVIHFLFVANLWASMTLHSRAFLL